MRNWLILTLFCCQPALSQNKVNLVDFFEKLSDTYNVVFSYNSNEISQFSKISIPLGTELNDILSSIHEQTQLIFELIDTANYVVTKPEKKGVSICGTIKNSKNTPLENVAIFNDDQNSITNKKGFFRLLIKEPSKKASISINLLGYQPLVLPISFFHKECNTIILNEQSIDLDEIIISNYITRGIVKKENGSIQLNLAHTGVLPGVIEPDVLQSLQLVPGVQSSDETISGLQIRGGTPDQNLVLFDDVKVYQSDHFFGLISVFNPNITKDIQLFRSATKAKYGGVTSGILSIGVDTEIPEKINAGLGSTLTHADAFVKVPILKNKLAIFSSARRGITDISNNIAFKKYSEVAFQNTSISDGLNNISEDITNAENTFLYEDYFAKLIFKPINQLKFSTSYIENKNDLFFRGVDNVIETNFQDNILIKSYAINGKLEYKNYLLGEHSIQLSKTNYNKKYTSFNKFDPASIEPNILELTFGKENFIEETTLNYLGQKKIFKNVKIEFGYQRSRSEIGYVIQNFGTDFNVFEESLKGGETSQSYFSDFDFEYKKAHINLGVRRQYFNRFNVAFWEPRLFLNYKILDKLWLKFSAEKKHQSISQVTDIRNDGLGSLFDRLWVVSTPNDIPIQESNQTAVGLDFQKQGWTLDIEAYHKKVNGIGILLNNDIFSPKNSIGTNTIKGIDFLVKKKWQNYQTWLSYSLSKSKYQFREINNNTSFNGSFDTPHNFVWTHSYTYKNLEMSLGWRYHSGIPYTEKQLDVNSIQSNFINLGSFNAHRLPDYQRFDFSSTYYFKLGKSKNINARLGITLQNVTNKRNVLSRDFRVITVTDSENNLNTNKRPFLQRIDRLSLGFTPNIVFRLSI